MYGNFGSGNSITQNLFHLARSKSLCCNDDDRGEAFEYKSL